MDELKRHTLSHEGRFECRACKHRSLSMDDLDDHEAIHKKHECGWCGKMFFRTNNLRFHILVHTGEHAFHYTNCPEIYKHERNLQNHLQKRFTKNAYSLFNKRYD